MTIKEISSLWGVSESWVNTLCKQGRIHGAVKVKSKWFIPDNAKKPIDARLTKTSKNNVNFKFIDLFAGIGGFHQAM